MLRSSISPWRFWIALHLWALGSALWAAEPAVRALDIRGIKIGGTTTLTIDGDDLGKTPRLLLPFNVTQTLKPNSTDKKATFDVTLGDDVSPGYYHLRLVTEGGVSLPTLIGVDRIAQQTSADPIQQLPVAVHGTLAGAAVVEAKFQGKAKQRVMVEVEAQRLGAKLRPVVHLYNARKLQLAWVWGTPALFGDCRLEAILPEDGSYSVTLHDAEYAAVAPSFYRLRIGEWSRVDQVFPSVVAKNQAVTITATGFTEAIKAPANPGFLPLSFPKAGVWSGPRPFVMISSHAEYIEAAAKEKLQEIAVGLAGVSGRLTTPYEEDRYRVAVTPGSKVKLEVFAERIGSPIDCALVVRNEQGVQLVRAEDAPGTLDPVLEYTVPDKVTAIIVGIDDAQGRGGPSGAYRLVIEPQFAAKDNFKLTTTAQRISLPIGGRTIVPVQADRRGGYLGKIDLAPSLQMPGVKLTGTTIPEGADGTLVTIERSDAFLDASVTSLRGRTKDGAEQVVGIKGHPLERLQPWLAAEIALAPTNEAAGDFAVDWRELPETAAVVPASRLLLPVKLTRPMSKNTVKLTLVTSQNTPLLNNVPDPNKALRQDKLGELAATVTTGDVTMLVPPDLSAPTYDVTVLAELLDPAKKVLATAYTPVRRMAVVLPLALKLAGPERIETPFDPKKGGSVKIAGKVERREGLKADIAIALTGLPAGAKADAVTVKADATDFVVNVTFPPTIAPGEIKGVKLSGSYAPDGKVPNVRVRSREVEVTFVIQAPIK